MTKPQADQLLTPSVLDRLLDDDPGVTREPHRSRSVLLREMKQAVRRDLENLLNTRCSILSWPDSLSELRRSLVNYGLPDFTGANMGSPEGRDELRLLIEDVIRRCEPRFKTVRVVLVDAAEPVDRTLRFRIDAMLRVEPAPEPVVFDSAMEPGTGAFEVSGEKGAR